MDPFLWQREMPVPHLIVGPGTNGLQQYKAAVDTEGRLQVALPDPLPVTESPSDTATTTTPTVTTSSSEVLATNSDRTGLLISNPGPSSVFVNFGGAATTAHHEVPSKGVLRGGAYTNTVTAITSSGSQVVAVTEFEA